MNLRKTRVAKILALNVCAMLTAMAHAAEPAKQTQFSTNGPVEVPGMMLDTGQYLFKLIEPEAQRNVLQVFETVQLWTGDGTRLLSTMLTMPNYDLPPTDKTVFTFFERGPQQPKALRIWFAPGRKYGQELVYPKAQAAELAKSVGRGVLSLPAELRGYFGQLAWMVAEPNGSAAKAPVASPVSAPSASAPVNEIPEANTPAPAVPPMKVASPEASRPPRDSSLTANGARRGGVTSGSVGRGSASSISTISDAPVQSRTRMPEPKMIASAIPKLASLPKTASLLGLVAFMGLLGIAFGTVLRILALQLEHR
jgi:hypothetical protein